MVFDRQQSISFVDDQQHDGKKATSEDCINGDNNLGIDYVDGKTNKERLIEISSKAGRYIKVIGKLETEYSKLNFQKVGTFFKTPYHSPLEYNMFKMPKSFDLKNPKLVYLVWFQKMLTAVEGLLFQIKHAPNEISTTRTNVANLRSDLDLFNPKIVPAKDRKDTTKLNTQTLDELKTETGNFLQNVHQPILLNPSGGVDERRDKVVNLTLLKLVTLMMTTIRNAAHELQKLPNV